MAVYKYVRKAKWFRNIGQGNPGDLVSAYYEGEDEAGEVDPKSGAPDGGIPGTTYTVKLLTGYEKLLAPCPDFCNGGETAELTDEDINIIIDSSR